MKNIFLLLAGVAILASCSSPKYTYHFDTYDYNSGKKKTVVASADNHVQASQETTQLETLPVIEDSPLAISPEALTADASPAPAPAETKSSVLSKKYTDLSRSEKKEFRKELKAEVKKYLKAKEDGNGAVENDMKAMDYNLKMAIIFGAVALTLSFFGGVNSVFWILSVVALVIGVVFFIKWIAEQ